MKEKKFEIQIQEDEEKKINEALDKKEMNLSYINKILSEIRKEFSMILDNYGLIKAYFNMKKCIEYCLNDPFIRSFLQRI